LIRQKRKHIRMKYAILVTLISIATTAPVVAGSRIIDLKNTYNDYRSEYRKARSRKDKCHYVDLMRSYAQMIMVEGDASRALEWNAFLPRTGCRETPLIIDGSATTQSPNASAEKKTANSSINDCKTFSNLSSINAGTEYIESNCAEGGYMYIKVHR